MLRGAIIGFGNIAIQGHVPAWRRRHDVEIVAGTDARPAQRAALATHMPGARWYDSSDALLADAGLDFVDIATPPSSHAPLIRGALARRLHVLCEKPLVHSLDELGALRALAEEHGRVLHTVHNWHHAPIVRRTATLVREGAIGQVTRVDWHTLRTRPAVAGGGDGENWRLDPQIAGGGVLADHGWHVFYVVQRWIGEAPRSVSAHLGTRRQAPGPGRGRAGGSARRGWPAAGTIRAGSTRWRTSSSPRSPARRRAALTSTRRRSASRWRARRARRASRAAAASRSARCRADERAAPRHPTRAGRGRARPAGDARGRPTPAAKDRPGGRARGLCGHPCAQGARPGRRPDRRHARRHASPRRARHAARAASHRDRAGEH